MAEKYLTSDPALSIDSNVGELNPDKTLIVTDKNVLDKVIPALSASSIVNSSPCMAIEPGEDNKDLDTVLSIWDFLERNNATRRSLLLNIGGGLVTDIGGFAAATFKRGLPTINFPTTLLGAVDAATGGKTGFNFHGLKNEIGVFHQPMKVIISTLPFSTLPFPEILSGYAEMLKTAIITDRSLYASLLDLERVTENKEMLGNAVEKCVEIKDSIVAQDPREKGLRKVLNFGHTAGHAFESYRIERSLPVTHGCAVAHGMMVALILSHLALGFDSKELHHYASFLKNHYGAPLIACNGIDEVISKMNSDKKNAVYGQPSFTLLKEIGVPEINCIVDNQQIKEALEIYIDMIG